MNAWVRSPHVLGGGGEEASGATRRIADFVLGRWCGHRDHELDDVSGRAELATLAGGRDLREHVLGHVALRVPILNRDFVEHVDDVRQHGRGPDREARVSHVMRIGRLAAADFAKEWEYASSEGLEHLGRLAVLEA